MGSDLDELFGVEHQADDFAGGDVGELLGGFGSVGEGDIADAEALLGEVHGGGGFAGAGDAGDDDVGEVQGFEAHAVVVLDGEFHGAHAALVLVIDVVESAVVFGRADAGLLGEEIDEVAGEVALADAQGLAARADQSMAMASTYPSSESMEI